VGERQARSPALIPFYWLFWSTKQLSHGRFKAIFSSLSLDIFLSLHKSHSMRLFLMIALSLFVLGQQPTEQNRVTNTKAHTRKGKKEQKPTVSVARVSPQKSTPESSKESTADSNQPDDRIYPVKVVSQPSPADTRWFKFYVVVAAIGTAVNAVIMFLIFWQNKNTEKAADAAKKSADALINGERAWIVFDWIKPEDDFYTELSTSGVLGKPFEISISFTNWGKTPAWLEEMTFRFIKKPYGTFKWSLDDLPEQTVPLYLKSVAPQKSYERACVRLESGMLKGEDIEEIKHRKGIIYLYGFIRYRDIHYDGPKSLRETRFSYSYFVFPAEDMIRFSKSGEWQPAGPQEANSYT
jgi:hypothetical protein